MHIIYKQIIYDKQITLRYYIQLTWNKVNLNQET